MRDISVTINGRAFPARLDDNESARALAAMLPVEFDMSVLNGNEKYVYLDEPLPSNPIRVGSIEAGDIMLFGSDCLVIFYRDFNTEYSYTPVGRIANPEGLADAAGSDGARISFEVATG